MVASSGGNSLVLDLDVYHLEVNRLLTVLWH